MGPGAGLPDVSRDDHLGHPVTLVLRLSAPTGSNQAAMSTMSRTTVRAKTKISIKYLH